MSAYKQNTKEKPNGNLELKNFKSEWVQQQERRNRGKNVDNKIFPI